MSEIKRGSLVALPCDEYGIVKKVNTKLPWGFRYAVEIIKGGIFSEVGEIADFKMEQMEFIYQT